jgi:hypothetical protein
MRSKKLRDVLPELGRMMAKDFSDFSDEWEDVVRAYAEVFKWLNEVLWWNAEDIEAAAVEIIEEYIEKRKNGMIGNALFPTYDWLAYELGEMFYELIEELRMNVYDPEEDEEDYPTEPLL